MSRFQGGWTWVGPGLDLGWTMKAHNILNVNTISMFGLDYGAMYANFLVRKASIAATISLLQRYRRMQNYNFPQIISHLM